MWYISIRGGGVVDGNADDDAQVGACGGNDAYVWTQSIDFFSCSITLCVTVRSEITEMGACRIIFQWDRYKRRISPSFDTFPKEKV